MGMTLMRIVEQVTSFIIEALERLGGAMSGGGAFPPVGIM